MATTITATLYAGDDLLLTSYFLMEPHTDQHLTHLQPLLGVGVRWKEHIIDPMGIFHVPFDQESNF